MFDIGVREMFSFLDEIVVSPPSTYQYRNYAHNRLQ